MKECTECGAWCRTDEHNENEGLLPVGTCGECVFYRNERLPQYKTESRCSLAFPGQIFERIGMELPTWWGCRKWEKDND